ncbi:C-type lectin domain family 1 member B [Sarcophilus harrisii]|uniref:C-type lectin domain family 1 member B n=1 Tax=Sarcophilus harrisii TaxID=9305 RepID=G3W351_SARHA|nr:C-type lectin domain family 1 member B [Sarcophilus harrisii]
MQDEDGYITLNFKSRTTAVTSEHEVESAASPVWRPMALTLLFVCLGMAAGLVTLGIMSPGICIQQDYFHMKIENLSEILQKVAKNFCQELIQKSVGHKCNPCDVNWRYHGDKCYGFFRHNLTWTESKQYCAKRNATLPNILSNDVLDFIKGRISSTRWIGLSRNSDGNWVWEDGSPLSKDLFELLGNGENQNCAYFQRGKIYTSVCENIHYLMCEQSKPVRIDQLI